MQAVDFLRHFFIGDGDGDAGGEGVRFLEAVAGIEEDGVLFEGGDVWAEERHGHHERGVLDEDAGVAVVGMIVPGAVGDDDVGLPLADDFGEEFAVFEGGQKFAVVKVQHFAGDAPFLSAGFDFGDAALGQFTPSVAPVADVAIGHGAEFDVMALFGPFDGGAAGFVFGIIRVRTEDDDAKFAIGFSGVAGGQRGGDQASEEREECDTHGEETSDTREGLQRASGLRPEGETWRLQTMGFERMLGRMFADLTRSPVTDPLAIYRYRDGLYAVDLITTALKLDFFSWLEAHPSTVPEICAQFGFAERPVDVMITLFVANGWVQRNGEQLEVTPVAREHLCADSIWHLGPYYASLHERPIARDFLEVLKSDKPAGWSGDKASFDWHKAMEDEAFARNFTAAMDCRGIYLARALASKLDLLGRTRVLDIGAGSGIYASAIVAAHAGVKAMVLDQAPVDRIAQRLVEERGVSDRVEVVVGNMFDGLPEGCDVHLYSNVLHDWGVKEVRELLQVSYEALPVGGLLVIHDAFIDAAKSGPLHVAEYSCLLMHSTQGKCYSVGEYAALLAEVGFTPGPYQETVVGRGFMVALK